MKQHSLTTAIIAQQNELCTLSMIKKASILVGALLLIFNSLIASPTCTHTISTVAGNGVAGYTGDGSAATAAKISDPYGVAVDLAGNIYLADRGNNCIRKVNTSGVISTFAGTGTAGYSGDGGAATAATINKPTGVACDAFGNVYIADQGNHRIRKVNTSGVISTFAGNGTAGYSGDGGAASSATLNQPINVANDIFGNIFIVDFGNSTIRKVNTSGVITTVAGTGTPGFSGDGGPATAAKIYRATQVACDAYGNLYIDDENNGRTRKVNAAGVISTICGTGTDGFSGDGGPATAAQLNEAFGIAVDACGNVFIADLVNQRIRKIDTAGVISTICGTGVRGPIGDGGPATAAELYNPYGICVDSRGDLYIADNINHRIRKIDGCGACAISVPAISGTANVCAGATTTMSNASPGGTWSSSNTSVATIGSSTGIVNGVAAGTATITYALGVATATKTVTVNAGPAPIVGDTIVGVTGTIFLHNSVPGGTWVSSDTTILYACLPCGYVTGLSAGPATVTYTVGGCYTLLPMTVVNVPAITGTTTICAGSSTTLSHVFAGGVWISANPAVANVGLTTGVLTGVANGTISVSYKVYGATVSTPVTVHAMPAPITGSAIVTTGSTVTLSNATTGGTWSSSNTSIVTVNATTGVVTGVANGTGTITYTLGVCFATYAVTAMPVAPITGVGALCVGTTSALSNATTGGVWSSSNTSIATVHSTSGLVSGIATGSATISYTVSGYTRTYAVSVGVAPTVGSVSGIMSFHAGGTTTLSGFGSDGTPSWSSSNTTVATVDASGVVSGISVGTAVITYSLTNGCGTSFATAVITVFGDISGVISACTGGTTTLTGTTPGGVWSSSNTAIATIDPVTGVVNGIAAGTSSITYTTGSTATVTVTILPLPSITGTVTNVTCNGYTNGNIDITVTGGSTSGSWLYYTYSWSNGSTANGAWGIPAGTYSVTATDPNGCAATESFTVTEPTAITTSGFITDTLVGCDVGIIELTVAGGVSPYNFVWSNGETTQNIYGLLDGEYFVNVTDANGCMATGWYYVEYCLGCLQSGARRSGAMAVAPPARRAIDVKAYPNPFATKTNITFTAPINGQATVEVTNAVTGQQVGVIFNEYTTAGSEHSAALTGDALTPGVYLYKITIGSIAYTGKLLMTK